MKGSRGNAREQPRPSGGSSPIGHWGPRAIRPRKFAIKKNREMLQCTCNLVQNIKLRPIAQSVTLPLFRFFVSDAGGLKMVPE